MSGESAAKSPLAPAQIFGARVREIRRQRGLTQAELAELVRIDRTTLNKLERGVRGDVSISQLFLFAEALQTSPIYLLTPAESAAAVELTIGGRVLEGEAARAWIRGWPPPGANLAEFFFTLPRDEQREILLRVAGSPAPNAAPTNIAIALAAADPNRREAVEAWVDAQLKAIEEEAVKPPPRRARKDDTNA